jgi:putative hydrolase of the HAD superfamily
MHMLKYALFDLDDTLYDASSGLWSAMQARMEQYIVDRLTISPDAAAALRLRYARQYGTTLNGLRAEYAIDSDEYLAHVHNIDLSAFIQPNSELRGMLGRIRLRKAIFTNADLPHARRVLEALGIVDCFEVISDITARDYACKPDARAYHIMLAQLGASPSECVYVDDAPRNLSSARELGILTILVSAQPSLPPGGADHWVDSVLKVEAVLNTHMQNRQPPGRS